MTAVSAHAATDKPQERHTIAIVIGHPFGGIRRHVHALLFGLDPRQFRFVYFYPPARLDKRGLADIELFARQPNIVLSPLRHVETKPHRSDLANLAQIRSVSRREHCALYHGHGAKGGLYARLARLLNGGKAIYTPHGGVIHPQFGRVEHQVYWAIEKLLRPLTHHFVAESGYSQSALVKQLSLPPDRCTLIYNGVTPNAGDEPRTPQGRTAARIAVIGMIRHEKGQDIAIRVARHLKDRRVAFDMIIVGDGPMRSAIEAEARALKVDDIVSFTGDIDDVTPVLDDVDLVLIPSRHESFGYIALEAALRRRPVIAAAVGGLRETVLHGKTGILVDDPSPARLADVVAAAIAGTWAFDFDAAETKTHQEKFLEETMLRSVARIYHDLLSIRPQVIRTPPDMTQAYTSD